MNQPQPFLVSRKRIRSIKITRTGWAVITLTFGLGLAGLNTGNNLLYLIFGMFLSMLLINGILSSSSLYNLLVTVVLPQRLYVGENNPVKIEIKNLKKRIPSYALTLIPEKNETNQSSSYFLFKIGALKTHRFVHYQYFPRRGELEIPNFRLTTSYPFGLIEKFIPIRLDCLRIVYPQLRDVKDTRAATTNFHGDYLSGKRGIGVNPYGVRDFIYGDDVRHTHWPSFAKVGKWMVKDFEQEKKSKLTLNLLVGSGYPEGEDARKRREQAVSLAASLLMYFLEENREVGLMINNRELRPTGSGYVDFYLTALALFDDTNKEDIKLSHSTSTDPGTIVGISEGNNDVTKIGQYHMLLQASEEQTA